MSETLGFLLFYLFYLLFIYRIDSGVDSHYVALSFTSLAHGKLFNLYKSLHSWVNECNNSTCRVGLLRGLNKIPIGEEHKSFSSTHFGYSL